MALKGKRCPREGTRVVAIPSQKSLPLYPPGNPIPWGSAGTVVTMPLGGRKRQTCMPGPGGGLVYVRFDNGTTAGVSRHDLFRAGAGGEAGDIGAATVEYTLAGADAIYVDDGYLVEDTRSGITKSVLFTTRAAAERFNRQERAGFIWKVKVDVRTGRIVPGSQQPLD